jgi:hypothetical protein
MPRSSVHPVLHGEMQIALGVPWLDWPLEFPFNHLFRSGLIFWLEIIYIGTLRARYRVEHYNVAKLRFLPLTTTVKLTHVAYEEGDEENLAKKDL